MKKLQKIIYSITCLIVGLTILCSVLSIFRHTEINFLEALDFPRIQFFITAFICLLLFSALTKAWRWGHYLVIVGLVISMIIHGNHLICYTTLVDVSVPTAEDSSTNTDQFSILLMNVKMSNKEHKPFIELVEKKEPDLILVMEVDDWWDEQLIPIEKKYPYTQKAINEVSYGMSLYSKLPLKKATTNYLHNEQVPSFESTIVLASGKEIRFYGAHPPPPKNYEDIPDNEGKNQMELKIIGQKVKNQVLPTLIAGDINDVVWSNTDQLTQTENLLFDIRKGRGFYNSFNAEYFFMRWPLDHVFVTKEFKLKMLESLPSVGSDHYPIYVELVL